MSNTLRPVYVKTLIGNDLQVTGWDGTDLEYFSIYQRDSILLEMEFLKSLGGSLNTEVNTVPLDLSGIPTFHVALIDSLNEGYKLYSWQDLFNQGDDPDNENLAEGKVTAKLNLDTEALNDDLNSSNQVNDYIDAWLIVRVDLGAGPCVITSFQIRVYKQPLDGFIGTPPLPAPTYYTKNDVDSLLADSNKTSTISSDTTIVEPAHCKTWMILVDCSAGDREITLMDPSALENLTLLRIRKKKGTHKLTMDPVEKTVNGVAGTHYVEDVMDGWDLIPDGDGNWLNDNRGASI